MSESVIERELERMVEPIAERVARRLLDEAARHSQTAAHADTEEARELRRICSLEYLTKREAALFLNVSESHIDNLMADDASFPVHRVGAKNVRLRRVELVEWTRAQGRKRLRVAG